MKKALATIAIGLTTAASSLAGPSWGFTLGNGAGFSWNGGGPRTMPYYGGGGCSPRPMYYRQDVYTFGPQYYRVHGISGSSRVINRMDAPIVIQRRNWDGQVRSKVVPRSWD